MIIELDRHFKVIRPESKAMFPYSNSLYIDSGMPTMIDAGAGGRAYAALAADRVQLLLLSHYHFDHTHGISLFGNARKMVGQEELWAFQDEQKFLLSSGYHHWEELLGDQKGGGWSRAQELPDDVAARPGFRLIEMDGGVFRDGDELQLGETRCITLHTPGHSPGHYAFFFPDEKILFSADLDISPRGPWYGGEYSDFDDLVQSIEKLIALQAEVLVTSHRKVFYGNIEQLFQQYINVSLDKEKRIFDFLQVPRSLDDLLTLDDAFETIMKTPHTIFWAKMMILKHLDRLIKHGKIEDLGNYRYVRI